MPEISVERRIGETKRAVLGGLDRYNGERLPPKRRSLAISLRDEDAIVGGVFGVLSLTVLAIKLFWVDEALRGKGHGTALIGAIEQEARRLGAVRAYLDTMSFQAPGFYRACGYQEFGTIDGYPNGVTRHWFTKAL
jgi:GNAT superfamily N-acetyltransferase